MVMRAILIPRTGSLPPIDRPHVRASIAIAVLVLSGSFGAACASTVGSDRASSGALSVVAAFYPVQEAAQRVGGSLVDVTNLTPPGVEPHDLELSPDQVESIATADVVLYLGGGSSRRSRTRWWMRRASRSTSSRACPPWSLPTAARRGWRSIRTCGSTPSFMHGWWMRCVSRSRRRRPTTPRRSEPTPIRSRARSRGWPVTIGPASRRANARSSSRTTPRSATWPPSTD